MTTGVRSIVVNLFPRFRLAFNVIVLIVRDFLRLIPNKDSIRKDFRVCVCIRLTLSHSLFLFFRVMVFNQ